MKDPELSAKMKKKPRPRSFSSDSLPLLVSVKRRFSSFSTKKKERPLSTDVSSDFIYHDNPGAYIPEKGTYSHVNGEIRTDIFQLRDLTEEQYEENQSLDQASHTKDDVRVNEEMKMHRSQTEPILPRNISDLSLTSNVKFTIPRPKVKACTAEKPTECSLDSPINNTNLSFESEQSAESSIISRVREKYLHSPIRDSGTELSSPKYTEEPSPKPTLHAEVPQMLKKGQEFSFNIVLKSTESLQSPLTPKGGVVVKSGDRCVAPAKSKPKKRTCVGEGPDSPQGMEHLEWSEESFAVQELAAMFKDRYPIMLRVTQGYSGDSGVEYAADQVLQIHSSAIQKRVLATDALNRVISIPVDYPVNVQVLEKKTNRNILLLHDVLRTTSMPFVGRVAGWANEQKRRPGLDLLHLELRFIKVVESPFLRGNAIIDGWIDQMEIIILPSILGLELSVGLGLRGAGDDEWREYKSMFERTIRHLKFDNTRGFKEAVIVPDMSDINMNNDTQQRNNKVYENLQNSVPAPGENQLSKDPIYENLKGKKSNSQPRSNTNGDIRQSSASIATNYTEANITQMFDSVIQTAENVQLSQIQKGKPLISVPSGVQGSRSVKDIAQRMERSAETPKAVVSPTVQEPKASGPFIVSVGLENEQKVKYRKPSHKQRVDARNTLDVEAVGEEEKRKYEAVAKLRPVSKEYGLAMGTGIQNVDDIPEELYDLTVEDVCTCLQLLNMQEYSSGFRRKQVDGGLLMDLDENVLKKEFDLTPFNASKLLRFTRGWRPKLT